MSHVSVMIPAYNHAHLIGRTIESVLNQHFQDFDIVIVDDASCDNTPQIASQYCADLRVRYVRNEQNLGLAGNWNRCLTLAGGPLVMVLGDDDMLDASYLTVVSRIFEQYPQVGLAYSPVRYVDLNDQVLSKEGTRPSRCYQAGDEAVAALLKGGIATVTTVLRRTCYERLGKYNENIKDGPDIELCARIASHYDIYDLGQVYGSFRLHGEKQGYLSYTCRDRLDSYVYGSRLIWECLSPERIRALGVSDLEKYIAKDGARFALNGAIVMIGYGRPDLTRHYLRRAVELDKQMWRSMRFWRAAALLISYPLSRKIVRDYLEFPKHQEHKRS